MRRLALSVLLLAGACASAPRGEVPGEAFHVERLGDRTYAVVRHDPESYANNANSMVVIGDSAVLVVDAQFTREATLTTIAAIRRLTKLPVRYVVITHWHDDHAGGRQVYRDSFPNPVFIAQANTATNLSDLGVSNRQATWDAAPRFTERTARLMKLGLGFDSTPASPMERQAMANTIKVARRYAAEAHGYREVTIGRTFDRATTLSLGGRSVELHWYGPAVTDGDAVVWVPDVKAAAVGDLVGTPVTFAFGSHPASWVSVLDSVRALGAERLVPGHGAVLSGDAAVTHLQAMLRRIETEVAAAKARGVPADSMARVVTLADERAALAVGDQWPGKLFAGFFVAPAAAAAAAEQGGH